MSLIRIALALFIVTIAEKVFSNKRIRFVDLVLKLSESQRRIQENIIEMLEKH